MQNVLDVARVSGYGPRPATEAAVLIDGVSPLAEELTLGPVLVVIDSLGLQHQHIA